MKALRIAIAIVLTIILFITARYIGPNREYTVSARIGDTVLEHTAPRGHEYAIPGAPWSWPEEGEVDIAELGLTKLTVIARPAPAGDLLSAIELQGKPKGGGEWTSFPRYTAQLDLPPEDSKCTFEFELPGQPWTTKYLYRFTARGKNNEPVTLAREDGEPMMIRFKGPAPAWIVLPHILCMFGGFLFIILAAFGAVRLIRGSTETGVGRSAWWAWALLFIGGVPIGVLMNWYAFHVTWEAVPFGYDVTDNKTQVALVFWGLAAIFLTRRPGKHAGVFALLAAILSLAMYMIPHSL